MTNEPPQDIATIQEHLMRTLFSFSYLQDKLEDALDEESREKVIEEIYSLNCFSMKCHRQLDVIKEILNKDK